MSRLQKKCFIVSAGVHLLLFIILLVGPAFLSSKSHSEDVQAMDFYPSKLIDAAFAGGGNRNAKPPAPIQPPSQPPVQAQRQPPPEKSQEADPPKPTAKPKIDPDSVEMAEPKRHKPQINTTLTTRKIETSTKSKPKSISTDTQAQERQLTDNRRRLARQLTSAAESIRANTSSATSIEDPGPGGGGPSYASYAAWVKTVYENAWEVPEDTASDDAITKVTVTIACDGTVLSGRISRPSGDSPVDKSVQRTLDRVTFIRPFPDGVKEKQRTYIINFNLKAKRGLA